MTAAALTLALLVPDPYPYYTLDSPAELFAHALAGTLDSADRPVSFAQVADQYDVQWGTGTGTPADAVNRGRAHVLAGSLPRAVRAFRDGLARFPWDTEIQAGLDACRRRVAYPDPPTSALRTRPDPPTGLRHRVGPLDVLLASTVGSLLLTVGLVARRSVRPPWAGPVAVGGGLTLLVVAAVAVGISAPLDPGRVVAAPTPLRTGNGVSYPARLTLPAGAEVRERLRRGGWVQVELPGGGVGWVPEASVVGGG